MGLIQREIICSTKGLFVQQQRMHVDDRHLVLFVCICFSVLSKHMLLMMMMMMMVY